MDLNLPGNTDLQAGSSEHSLTANIQERRRTIPIGL
jgi:hypothetical protein